MFPLQGSSRNLSGNQIVEFASMILLETRETECKQTANT
jgi:hypothetical protein